MRAPWSDAGLRRADAGAAARALGHPERAGGDGDDARRHGRPVALRQPQGRDIPPKGHQGGR